MKQNSKSLWKKLGITGQLVLGLFLFYLAAKFFSRH